MGLTHKRLNARKWRFVRFKVIRRDKFTCQACGKMGGRLEVHHVIPLYKLTLEEAYKLSNLKLLCRNCHFLITSRERGQGPSPQGEKEILAWDAYAIRLVVSDHRE